MLKFKSPIYFAAVSLASALCFSAYATNPGAMTTTTQPTGNYTKILPNGVKIVKKGNVTKVYIPKKVYEAAVAKMEAQAISAQGSPTASIAAPNAFGAGTAIFVAGTYVNHWANTSSNDGLMSVGSTFGDPYKYIGILASAAITSLGTNNDTFGSNGLFGLRVNHYFGQNTAIAVGMSEVAGWGGNAGAAHGYYGAVTHSFKLGIPMVINAGLGTGGLHNTTDGGNGVDNGVSPFVSMGFSVYKNLSLILDYTTYSLNTGAAYTVLLGKHIPLFISASENNVNKYQGSAYFQANAGLAYAFS